MKKNSALIIISCLIGLITAFSYSSRIRHLRAEIQYFSEKIPVLTATRNIETGEYLKTEDLEEKNLFKEQLSRRAISPRDLNLVLGRRVIHPVPKGDPVLWTDFPEGPRLQYPSEKIPSGYRAIALPADEIHTLVHFISPGDTVDIVSSTINGTGGQLVSRIIAEKVVVLGVGNQLIGRPYNPDAETLSLCVTLLVEPVKALTILQSSQSGQIHFLARGSSPFTGMYSQDKSTIRTNTGSGERP